MAAMSPSWTQVARAAGGGGAGESTVDRMKLLRADCARSKPARHGVSALKKAQFPAWIVRRQPAVPVPAGLA